MDFCILPPEEHAQNRTAGANSDSPSALLVPLGILLLPYSVCSVLFLIDRAIPLVIRFPRFIIVVPKAAGYPGGVCLSEAS